jgi:hypothetical protein
MLVAVMGTRLGLVFNIPAASKDLYIKEQLAIAAFFRVL